MLPLPHGTPKLDFKYHGATYCLQLAVRSVRPVLFPLVGGVGPVWDCAGKGGARNVENSTGVLQPGQDKPRQVGQSGEKRDASQNDMRQD